MGNGIDLAKVFAKPEQNFFGGTYITHRHPEFISGS